MTATRLEQDPWGTIAVPAQRLWGAHTQRALQTAGGCLAKHPTEIIQALALLKKACARIQARQGHLAPHKAQAICTAADEILAGQHGDEFPLTVWQAGADTHANANINEVLANRASELLGTPRGRDRLICPLTEVNHAPFSHTLYHTAMHIAAHKALNTAVLPALQTLRTELQQQRSTLSEIVKLAPAHHTQQQDEQAPQSDWERQLADCDHHLRQALPALYTLHVAQADASPGAAQWMQLLGQELGQLTELPWVITPTPPFTPCAALLHLHSALQALARCLVHITHEIHQFSAEAACQLEPLFFERSQPCSTMGMVCAQVIGNEAAINYSSSAGPEKAAALSTLVAYNFLQSTQLLAEGMHCLYLLCHQNAAPFAPSHPAPARSTGPVTTTPADCDRFPPTPLHPGTSDYLSAQALDHYGLTKGTPERFP